MGSPSRYPVSRRLGSLPLRSLGSSGRTVGKPTPPGRPGLGRAHLLAALVCLASFFVVTTLVFTRTTQGPDASLALAINHADLGGALTGLMVLATDYGREYFWVGVVAVMLVFGDRRTKVLAIELGILFVVGIVVGEAAKVVLYRARPFETIPTIILRVATDTDSSSRRATP